jgi:drug/metabolite transporter (DMT)-like permease
MSDVTEKPSHPLALWAVFLGVVCWGWGPVLVRGISAPFMAFTPVRMLIGLPIMAAITYASGGRLTRAVWRASFVPSIFYTASLLCAFASFQKTSIATATLIVSLNPIALLVVAPFVLKEKVTKQKIFWCLVAVAGVSLVVFGKTSGGGNTLEGDLYAVGNLIFWTTYAVGTKRVRDAGVHPYAFLTVATGISVVLLFPLAFATGTEFGEISGNDWWLMLLQVVVAGVMGMGSIAWANRYMDASLVALLGLGSPVLSSIFAWWIFEQTMNAVQMAGAAVMLGAVATVVARKV